MTDSRPRTPSRYDPLVIAAAGLFILAVLCAAYPAFRPGSQTLGGLLLLLGLGGVAFFSIVALRGGHGPIDDAAGGETFIDALAEPAALATPDGRIVAWNPAWEAEAGGLRRLPKGAEGGLFAAMTAARRGETGVVTLSFAGHDRVTSIGLLGARRAVSGQAGAIAPDGPRSQRPRLRPRRTPRRPSARPSTPSPPRPPSARPCALEGADPLDAVISEANSVIEAMAGGKPLVGARLSDLIEPVSWIEAAARIRDGRSGPVEVRLAHDRTRIAHLYLTRSGEGFVALSDRRPPNRSTSSCSSANRRRCARSASWPAASPTISTTC